MARSGMLAGQVSSITASARGVGRKQSVMREAASQAIKRAGERRLSAGGKWTLAPLVRYGQISHTQASKAGLASCVARSAGVTEYVRRCQAIRFATLAWEMGTP